MNDKERTIYKLCLITIGILGSFLFILCGYWVAAAIGISHSDGIGFFKGLKSVLAEPFEAYFNDYTPIIMVLAFIIFETLFFLYMMYSRRKECMPEREINVEKNNISENEYISENANDFLMSLSEEDVETIQMENYDVISGFGIISQKDISSYSQNDDIEFSSGESVEERVAEFNDNMTMELLEYYDLQQITAMLMITKYIDNITTDMLKRMFRPSMPATEIGEYIKIFYE